MFFFVAIAHNVPAICAWAWLSDQLWLYQLDSMGEGKAKLSICCGCHDWRIIALLPAGVYSNHLLFYSFSDVFSNLSNIKGFISIIPCIIL